VLALEVGLRGEALDRFPNELSGGQRHRIGIARSHSATRSGALGADRFDSNG